MSEPATAIAAVGSGVARGVGGIVAANQEHDQAEKEFEFRKQEAFEIRKRTKHTIENIRREGTKVIGAQKSGFAKGGVDLSGSTLTVLEDTAAAIEREVIRTNREGEFKAMQVERGAQLNLEAADNRRTAAYIGAGASVLTSAASAAG